MFRELLTDTFSSPEVRDHYHDSRAQAAAFLMTVGAKALVLQDQKAASSIDHDGINDEAEIRSQMVNEERIRSIRRKIMSKTAISVLKRGRDEKIRNVNIVLHQDRRKGTFLTWKSKLNYVKKFDIAGATEVSRVYCSNNRSSSSRGRSTSFPSESKKTSFGADSQSLKEGSHSLSRLDETYFLRLTNQARSLDLSFASDLEMEAFLLVLQKHVGVTVRPEVLTQPPPTSPRSARSVALGSSPIT